MKIVGLLFTVLLLAVAVTAATAETITIKSGNAPVGQRDPLVTVRGGEALGYPSSGIPLQNALVVATPSYWCSPPEGSSWLTPDSDAMLGYIYEVEFLLPASFTHASLTLLMCSDDSGLAFLNGHQVSPNTTGFAGHSVFIFDNSAAFMSGNNVLQFHVANNELYPSPTGVAFSASVTYTSVPEPCSILVLLTGIGRLGVALRRRT